MNNFYDHDKVFEFIYNQILNPKYQKSNGKLHENDIDEAIKTAEDIVNNMPNPNIIFGNGNFQKEHFKQLKKELEKKFDVEMKQGMVIQGIEQNRRDTTWYSDNVKAKNDNFYWDRLKEFLNKQLPPKVLKVIDEDTDVIMNQIGDPRNTKFDIYGMVVGHVQSGKTANYSSLISKAADIGYKFIIVIAGDKNNLRKQTQIRINEAFVGKNSDKKVGVGLIKEDIQKQPVCLTTKTTEDFNKRDAARNSQGVTLDNIKTPLLLVIKKNAHTLKNVIDWLKSTYKNKIRDHAMLLIDDESDYASINTREKEDPTAINKGIRTILEFFEKSSYVAYTATPYANIFIDYDDKERENLSKDLFPRDFIYALDAPNNYCGADKIFGKDENLVADENSEDKNKCLEYIFDWQNILPLKHKKDHIILELPNSLLEAINVFILNIAIRYLRNQENKHNSMLVNVSRFSDIHSNVADLIYNRVENIKRDIVAYGKLKNSDQQSQIISEIKNVFDNKFNVEFSWNEVLYKITDIINSVLVREVHQNSKRKLEYKENDPINVIAVGGLSLSRGFTLEGLSVSYFIRNTIFYDTLMQMGRWFGYRNDYEDLCKIYIPKEIAEYFGFITEATNELMQKFKEMSENGLTPEDFGLAIRQDPDNQLQITARNKRKSAQEKEISINLNGALIETVYFSQDIKTHNDNLKILVDLVADFKNKFGEKQNIFKDINKEIILEFVNKFKVIHMPKKEFIIQYLKDKDRNWDVVLYEGTGKNVEGLNIQAEKRNKTRINKKGFVEFGQRKISSGDPEKILLDQEIYKQSKEINKKERTLFLRKNLKNPVLMLHVLETQNDEFACEKLPAYGVCFPYEGVANDAQTIKYLINKVYQDQLQEELELSECEWEDEYDE